MILIWIFLALIAVLLLLRWVVHRSLAPERIIETGTPAGCGLSYADVRIPTANGKSLSGWYVPRAGAAVGPAVAIIHGWGGNAETMLPLAQPLHQAGFAVLLFDARCHGRSDEDSFTSMPRFAEDLSHAVDWLQRRDDVDPRSIALVGHSVGAAAALLVAARRSDIAAAVSIAAFAHPVPMMRRWFSSKRIPYLPVGWLILRYAEWLIGHRFNDIAPVNSIRQINCRTLLVHGADDAIVPLSEAHAIHAARPAEHVQLIVVAGSHDDYADLEMEIPVLVKFLSVSDQPLSPCLAESHFIRQTPAQD